MNRRKNVVLCSDSTISNLKIEELISASGFEPLHIGGINQSTRIEVFGDLYEFGKLGKTVSLAEAKTALFQSKLQRAIP